MGFGEDCVVMGAVYWGRGEVEGERRRPAAFPEDPSDEPGLDSSARSIDLFSATKTHHSSISFPFFFIFKSVLKSLIQVNTISSHLAKLWDLWRLLIRLVRYRLWLCHAKGRVKLSGTVRD